MTNLYLMEQYGNQSYNSYHSCVVAADTAILAANIHPNTTKSVCRWDNETWVPIENIKNINVIAIGTTDKFTAGTVIMRCQN